MTFRRLGLLLLGLSCFSCGGVQIPDYEWETISLGDDHIAIEAADKSRRNSAIPTETAGDLVVPSYLNNRQVVSIGTRAFDNCTRLTSVTIPEGVTNISSYAFYNCTSLTTVVLPKSIKALGASAFQGCTSLATVSFAGDQLQVGQAAFLNCSGLRSLVVNAEKLTLADHAFFACSGLKSCELHGREVTVGDYAFGRYSLWHYDGQYYSGECSSLTNVVIEGSASVSINANAFVGCPRLEEVAVAGQQTLSLGASAFQGCTALNNVDLIGEQAATMGNSAFQNCLSLCAIALPNALMTVQTNTFLNCRALTDLVLPTNVVRISYRAFDTCTALSNVVFDAAMQVIEAQAFFGCKALETLTLPAAMTSVGDRAFEECSSLRTVTCSDPEAGEYDLAIGVRAFYKDVSLERVSLGRRVRTVSERAFSQCSALRECELSAALQAIGESAFENCGSLPSIGLPPSLLSIGRVAFYGCRSLSAFSIPTNRVVSVGAKAFNDTKYWNDWPDGGLVVNNGYMLGFKGEPRDVTLPDGCREIPAGMFEGMTTLTNVTVPASVKTVGSRAFAGSGVQHVALPGVTSLGVSSFDGCAALQSVVLAEGLDAIPGYSFYGCRALQSMDIPKSVRSIGDHAFDGCVELRRITGAKGVTSVGDYAFSGCVQLEPFTFDGDVVYGDHVFKSCSWLDHVLFPQTGTMADEYPATYAQIRSVVFSAGETSIGELACAGCRGLTSLSIPASVTEIASNAFVGCTSVTNVSMPPVVPLSVLFPEFYMKLANVSIPEGVTEICPRAFFGCAALQQLTLPASLESIGDEAFAGSGLRGGQVIPENVMTLGARIFADCGGLRAALYLGERPESAAADIYDGTLPDFVSGVHKLRGTWYEISTNGTKMLVSPWNGRRVCEWDSAGWKVCYVTFHANGGSFGDENGPWYRQVCVASREIGELPMIETEPEGAEFIGWFDALEGGEEITETTVVTGGMTVYAHWEFEEPEEPDVRDWSETLYEDDEGVSLTAGAVYDGYVYDDDLSDMGGGALWGTVTVTVSKPKMVGKTGETSAAVKASVALLGSGKKLTLSGTMGEDGYASLADRSGVHAMEIELGENGMVGQMDEMFVSGARDRYSSKRSTDVAACSRALAAWQGTFALALQTDAVEGDGAAWAGGYGTMTFKIDKKGVVKVSGTMADGTSLSAKAKMLVGEGCCCVPVVLPLYTGKRGGLGFLLWLSGDYVAVMGLTPWDAAARKGGGFAAEVSAAAFGPAPSLLVGDEPVFQLDGDLGLEDVLDEFLPTTVPILVKKSRWSVPKAGLVKYDREAEAIVDVRESENPSALKVTYKSSDGRFSGSFKAYTSADGQKLRSNAVTVKGVVIDGVGYGSALLKKSGCAAVLIQE